MSDASVVFFIKVAGASLTLLLSILLSRLLGAENVGIYFLSLSIVNTAIIVSMVGLSNAIIKYSAQSYAKGDWKSLGGLYKNSVVIVTLTAIISTLLIVVYAPWISSYIFHKHELCTPLRLMGLSILPINLVTIYVSLFKGIQKFAYATIAESLILSMIMVMIILLFSSKNMANVNVVGMSYLIAAIVNLAFGIGVWHFFTTGQRSSNGHFAKKKLIQTSLPLYCVALMNMVMGMSDTIMLGLWKDSHVVGIYGVTLQITAVSSMFLVVANTVVAPKFSILFKNEEHDSLSQLVRSSTFLMSLIAALFLVLFISFSDLILSLFGKEFVAGKIILIILAIGQFIALSTGPVAALLMMTGHEKFHRNTTIFSTILNIILNFLLIPAYDGAGAAFATAFSLSLKNILAVLHVQNKLKIHLFI